MASDDRLRKPTLHSANPRGVDHTGGEAAIGPLEKRR